VAEIKKICFYFFILILLVCIGHASATETIRVAGWSRMAPIIQDAANDYSQLHPGVSIVVTEADSSSALRLLSEGSIDIALSPDIDNSSGLDISAFKKTPIGTTAYVIIVNSNNPISILSAQDIRDIFHDKKTNWKQFGGTSSSILTTGLKGTKTGDRPSSDQAYFSLFLEKGESRLPVKAEMISILDILKVVSNEPGAISYIEYKYIDPDFSFNPKSRIKPISIRTGESPVVPSLDTIQSGSYPLVENLNIYTKINPNKPEQDFIDFLLSYEGQSYVKSNGQIPVFPGVMVIRKISSPQKILSPGYYFLDRDLNNSEIIQLNDYNESAFILINSNSVTLDGMGHTIDCTEAERELQSQNILSGNQDPKTTISPHQNGYLMKVIGISSGYQGPDVAFTNLTIRNITIKNCKNGIDVVFYQYPTIENVTLINNWKGIYFFTSTHTSVSNATFIGNSENIGSTNSDKVLVNGNFTALTGVNEYQMTDTPYNMNTPLPALNMGFIFLLLFLPKLIPKLFEGAFDYINERFFAPSEDKEQKRQQRYFRILHHWVGISLIGALVLGGGFYYASSPSQFEMFTLGMYILISIIVLVSHETMHYFTAKKLGIDVKYRLWVWGIIVILTSAILKNVVGQPVFTELDEEKTDIKLQALVMLSRPLTTILLSIPFVILWLNEANSEYAFLLLEISVVTSLIAFLPISPLDGEKVVKWNKLVWLAIFLPLFVGFLIVKWITF
jgi:phosphate transport system substrate-binding protein